MRVAVGSEHESRGCVPRGRPVSDSGSAMGAAGYRQVRSGGVGGADSTPLTCADRPEQAACPPMRLADTEEVTGSIPVPPTTSTRRSAGLLLRRAWPNRRPVSCLKLLLALEDGIGLARGYAYQVLTDLAQPWKIPIPLVKGQGNFGSRGSDPPASEPSRVSCILPKLGRMSRSCQ